MPLLNQRITELTENTDIAEGDYIPHVDRDDTTMAISGTTKYTTLANLWKKLRSWGFGEDAGANDTYVVTLTPAPAAYVTGEHYRFKANTANTGACTVNFNSLGAKTIKKAAGGITTDLADNDIRAGQWVDLVYDGTNMQMQSLLGNAPPVAGPATQIDETSGPTTLDIAGIVDGEFLKRVGTDIVSDSVPGGAEAGANSDITSMDGLTGALETPTRIDFAEGVAPGTPGAAKVSLYAKADGLLYSKDDAGAETLVSGGAGGGSIAPLVVEDANTVAQRNSTNNQNFNVYRNYNSGTDYQRIRVGWTGTAAEIISEGATQSASNIVFRVGGTATHGFNFGQTSLVPVTDVTMAFGSSSKYLNEIYCNTWITKSGGKLRFVSGANLTGPATGILQIKDDSGNSGSGTIRFDARTPSTITSDQNNYSVAVTGYFIRLATDASRTLTGLTFGGGGVGDGQVHLLVNVGSNDLVLAHESASSTAGNRFLCSTGANITLSANQAADIIYDGTTQRWRVFKRN